MSSSTETLLKKDDSKAEAVPEAKPGSNAASPDASNQDSAAQQVNITGRAVFAVETTGAGVVVRTAFLTEDNRLLDMPAVFPDMVYALTVVEDLKRQITQHFSQAAQVGVQVIANQMQLQAQQQQNQLNQDQDQDQPQDTKTTPLTAAMASPPTSASAASSSSANKG